MKRLEYIRQLPGLKDITANEARCPRHYTLDQESLHCPSTGLVLCDCEKCMSEEATINGEPAPYLFPCPVKPGQTVYQANPEDGCVYKGRIAYIVFMGNGWEADCIAGFGFNANGWMNSIFPTREEAEKKLKEAMHDE